MEGGGRIKRGPGSIQTPVLVPPCGMLASKFPSMLKPPAGEITGAMPAGGGVAYAARPQKSASAKKTPKRQAPKLLARPLRVASFKFMVPYISARLFLFHKPDSVAIRAGLVC